LFALILVAVVMALALAGIVAFLFLRSPRSPSNRAVSQTTSEGKDFSQAESISIVLGELGSEQGLTHLDQERDGTTTVEILDGVPTRTISLTGVRESLFFYFQIDPTFKQGNIGSVRIDVEYLDPYPGTIGVHYDALDLPALGDAVSEKRVYRDASRKTLTGSHTWKTVSFHTRDAGFANRQNGGADFRVWAKTPTLYLRRVTVTRTASPEDEWKTDYSQTNTVSLLMEKETPQDGLHHLAAEADGRTTLTNLDGVVCRHLQRIGRSSGFLYFSISPTFKGAGLTNARCEIEYYCKTSGRFRLQYDAMEPERHRAYKSVIAQEGPTIQYSDNLQFTRVAVPNTWRTATFLLTNGVFLNSQNGGADFRLEVSPPDIYVRRVTLTRE
jgi:hypothetical protein